MDPAETQNPAGCIWWCWYQGQLISQYVGQPVKTLHFCSNTQKVLYCIFFPFHFFNDGNWSSLFVQQKNSFKWLITQRNANISNKVKTNSGCCLAFLFRASPRIPICSRFGLNLAQRRVSLVHCSVLDFSSAVSVQIEVCSWCWSWVWFLVRSAHLSVGVRCGWAGARGWMAGCFPPSPW